MKYVVILGDGMADYPVKELDGKTPLEVALKPFIDSLAKVSEIGLLKTVPSGMKAGSDVANLSVLGLQPEISYTGRSPLEASSIGISLSDTDVTYRANLVTLSGDGDYSDLTMQDYSAGEISTEEAKTLVEFLKKSLDDDTYTLYSGVSYRHCLVKKNAVPVGGFTPPHDITGKPIKEYLPESAEMLDIMKKSYALLKNHPLNVKRIKDGKNPANSLWFWGEGTKPSIENYQKKFGVKAGMISAVDLLKGIAILSGMEIINVDGATGTYKTNFTGKAKACIDALKNGLDFVYLHMEAPDECGHQGDVEHKIYSIEQIDKVARYIVEELNKTGERFRVLICPDHPTPISTKTHASDPVPYLLYTSDKKLSGATSYTEKTAKDCGNFYPDGISLMKRFFY